MLSGPVDTVLVQGPDGIGKTTLLLDYAVRRSGDAIALFLKPNRSSYDLSAVVPELAAQALSLLGKDPASASSLSDMGALGSIWHELAYRRRRAGREVIFLVDGLAEVLSKEPPAAREIVHCLPFGRPAFRFAISGGVESLVEDAGAISKDYRVTFLVPDETKQILSELGIAEAEVSRVHAACNGYPSQVVAVRRLFKSGMTIAEILQRQPAELANTMKLEWNQAFKTSSEPLRQIVAVLAFDSRRHGSESLAATTRVSVSTVQELIPKATFLSASSDGAIDFISENFRLFAQRELMPVKQEVLSRIIDDLLLAPRSRDSVTRLPYLMTEAKQDQQVIDLMSPDYLSTMVGHTQSVISLQEYAGLAAAAAERESAFAAALRFRLLQSIALDITSARDGVGEVGALVAVECSDEALALARNAPFGEERLRLFAAALSNMLEKDVALSTELRDELRQLCTSVPVGTVDDAIVQIASDVFAVEPEAAIKLVERYTSATNAAHKLDWVLALLTTRSALRRRPGDEDAQRLNERISDPRARSLAMGLGIVHSGKGVDWILGKVAEIPKPTDQIWSLRLWLNLNARDPMGVRVAREAIDLAIKTREYSLTVPVLRQLAACLPYSADQGVAAALVGRIDALVSADARRSPTIEFVRLQLLLARAQVTYEPTAARGRLVELYEFISGIADAAIKAECLARLYSWLPVVDPAQAHDDIKNELKLQFGKTLRETAFHNVVALPILTPLVEKQPELAFSLCDQLNTDNRRDSVRGKLIVDWAERGLTLTNAPDVFSEIQKIADTRKAGRATRDVLAAVSRKQDQSLRATGIKLWDAASSIEHPDIRISALAFLYVCAQDLEAEKKRSLASRIESEIKNFGLARSSVHFGFSTAQHVAKQDPELGKRLIEATRSADVSGRVSRLAISAYTGALRLSARSVQNIAKNGRDVDAEMQRLLDLTSSMTDLVARACIVGELIGWLDLVGRTDLGEKIFRERLTGILEEVKKSSPGLYWQAFELVGHLIFSRHERFFTAEIGNAPQTERDRILRAVARSLATGLPATEPMASSLEGPRALTHKTCTDLVEVLRLADDDWLLFNTIRAIAINVSGPKGALTREQRTEVREELERLVASKLPCARKIQHSGFKWACSAYLLQMEGVSELRWRELLGYAKDIPNAADAAYTLMLIAAAMPSRFAILRTESAKASGECASAISVISERVDCLTTCAEEARSWDSRLAQTLLKAAVAAASGTEEHSRDDRRIDRLLDVAYRVSPDFALAMSTELDQDPVRAASRREDPYASVTEIRRRMLDDGGELSDLELDGERLADAAWRNLTALNGGLLISKPRKTTTKSLAAAGQWPLATSYPVFAWAVQNEVERVATVQDSVTCGRELMQSALGCAELVRMLSEGIGQRRVRGRAGAVVGPVELVTVPAGSRDKTREVIREWCHRKVKGYLKICDQYFGPEDIELLKYVLAADPTCRVDILTSAKHIESLQCGPQWIDAFRTAWSSASAELPPPTDISVVGISGDGRSPIHDRWWITSDSALDFGTSMNSLGRTQESSVAECDSQLAEQLESRLNEFLLRRTRSVNGAAIVFSVASL